ncbi:MAG: flagellar motor protein MotB [Planctomycetota bacterium]
MRWSTKQAEADEPQGAPDWMVTFSDCMTLLLTFFVLMLSFSSFDQDIIWKLKIIFSNALPSVSPAVEENRDAFLPRKEIQPLDGPEEGTEKPALARGQDDNLKKDTNPADFYNRKVFLVASKKVFWGKGTAVSSEGRNIMATMGSYLKEVPNRIVISETGPGDNDGNEELGLPRAWAVMEHLSIEQGVDRKRFSISATSVVAEESLEDGESYGAESETERMVEVVLLERSICN